MKISLIAAISKNKVIGRDGKLPWYLPEDLKRFKELTSSHVIIMGRKTFESIGRPLPNRTNIVITRDESFAPEGVIVAHSIDEALKVGKEKEIFIFHERLRNGKEDFKPEIFIIGGGQIYAQSMQFADRLYLTVVEEEIEGDTYFPDYSEFKKVIFEQAGVSDNLKYRYLDLEK